ncbi:MAG: hypothetical protein IJD36_03250 [Clostridia bacterium]|nr:hypothetical protein [Clostridia bacterium]
MATTTPQRERRDTRRYNNVDTRDRYYNIASTAVRVENYPLTRPEYIPSRIPASRPLLT